MAQRIIRTETARAYSDGFVAEMDADDDVVAVRLRLSTRHPVFDICDFFADADMYGLGKGVYPKDKAPPIPLHPHCMCRLEEVFSWELDISKAKNQVKQAGDKWLNSLSDRQRREVLGIAGDKAWRDGESWEKYLRNWKGLAKPETRLTLFREFSKETDITKEGFLLDKEVKAKSFHDKFYQVGLTKSPVIESMYREAREMLTHRSGTVFEDIVAIDFKTGKVIVKQNKYDQKHAVSFMKADEEILCSREECFELLHNHPGSTLPSVPDIRALIRRGKAKGTTVVGHDASVYRIEKLKQISIQEFDKMADRAYTKVKEKYRGYASDSLIENETAESIIAMLVELKIINFYEL